MAPPIVEYPWTSASAPSQPGVITIVPGGVEANTGAATANFLATAAAVPAGLVTLDVTVITPQSPVSGLDQPGFYFSQTPAVPSGIKAYLGFGSVGTLVARQPNAPYLQLTNWAAGATTSITVAHGGGGFTINIYRGGGLAGPAKLLFSNPRLHPLAPVPPPTPPPSITKLIPTAGPDAGGTLVDIIGTDLTGATGVDFGGAPGTGLTVDPSGGLATVTTPAHTPGPAPVTITTPAGTSNAETFTFEAPIPPGLPTLTGIDPTEGPETGGTTALLTGTNLTGTTGVDFGGTPATIITTTTTALLVTTPPHPAGTVNVTATDGTTTTDPLAFEFTEATGPPTGGPDVIANLVALLAAELGVPVSSRRSPTATKDSDPSVVVRRTGGPSKGVASDNPTVTIEAWAPTTTESFQLLQSARMVVIEAAEQGRAGLRRYQEFAGPADLPDPSTTNPRHTLTASVVTRIE